MSDLAEVVLRALRAETVIAAQLVELDFPSGIVRAWSGTDQLNTADGKSWAPVAQFGEISDIEQGSALEFPGWSVGLKQPFANGSDDAAAFSEAIASVRDEAIFGRAARVFLQPFDPVSQEAIGDPISQAVGVMTQLEYRLEGDTVAWARVQVEHVLSFGRGSAAGRLTDADQQARFPGDRALRIAPSIARRGVRWPRKI